MPNFAHGLVDRGLIQVLALGFPTRFVGRFLPFAFEGFGQPLFQKQAVLLREILDALKDFFDGGLTHGNTFWLIIAWRR
jgi:hypothetical protein